MILEGEIKDAKMGSFSSDFQTFILKTVFLKVTLQTTGKHGKEKLRKQERDLYIATASRREPGRRGPKFYLHDNKQIIFMSIVALKQKLEAIRN